MGIIGRNYWLVPRDYQWRNCFIMSLGNRVVLRLFLLQRPFVILPEQVVYKLKLGHCLLCPEVPLLSPFLCE